jgi:nicotinamide-nucleotide amidase
MHLEIVAVGSELTGGDVCDTNSAFIAREMWEIGLMVRRITVVGDFMDDIVSAVRKAWERGRESLAAGHSPQAVIVTGGLGPTGDDITREGVAKAFGRGLFLHQPSLDYIEARMKMYNAPLGENNKRQAYFPDGSEVIHNPNGTAPAFVLEEDRIPVYVLPGVPMEMKALVTSELVPRLSKNRSDCAFVRKTIITYGKGESTVDRELGELMDRGRNPLFGTLVGDGLVYVKILAQGKTVASAQALMDEYAPIAREKLGPCILGEDAPSVVELLVHRAAELGLKVGIAESCTGGLAGGAVTAVPGASEMFLGSIVAYDNPVKMEVLGVDEEVINTHGAVSIECAKAMAEGAKNILGADLAVSITGIAGPGGGTPEKPVGTVCFGLATDRETTGEQRQIRGDREMIRTRSVTHAIVLLLRALGTV